MSKPLIYQEMEAASNYIRLTASAPSDKAKDVAAIKSLCDAYYAVARPVRRSHGRTFIDLMVDHETEERFKAAIGELDVSEGGFLSLRRAWGTKGDPVLAHQSFVVAQAEIEEGEAAINEAKKWVLEHDNTGVTHIERRNNPDGSELIFESAIPVEIANDFQVFISELNRQ